MEAGYDATVSKFSQKLKGINIVDRLEKKEITSDLYNNINISSYLMFLIRNKSGAMKVYIIGRLHWECISKEGSSSPTISTYVWFISCVLDVMEGSQV